MPPPKRKGKAILIDFLIMSFNFFVTRFLFRTFVKAKLLKRTNEGRTS